MYHVTSTNLSHVCLSTFPHTIHVPPSSSIRIVKYIGHGQFGTVNLAVWTQQYVEPMEVAVKVCRAGANEAIKTKFLKEAAIMGQFHHPNVVKLYGVVTMSERVWNYYIHVAIYYKTDTINGCPLP